MVYKKDYYIKENYFQNIKVDFLMMVNISPSLPTGHEKITKMLLLKHYLGSLMTFLAFSPGDSDMGGLVLLRMWCFHVCSYLPPSGACTCVLTQVA
jgi:hypothetical protein